MPWWAWTLLGVAGVVGIVLAISGRIRGLWLTGLVAVLGVLVAVFSKRGTNPLDRRKLDDSREEREAADAEVEAERDKDLEEIEAKKQSDIQRIEDETKKKLEEIDAKKDQRAHVLANSSDDDLFARADRVAGRSPKLPKP